MTRAGSGAVFGASTRANTARAMTKALRGLSGAPATYGFMFVSPELDLGEAMKEAALAAPGVDLIGCTTAGEIDETGLIRGGVSVLLVADTPGRHQVRFTPSTAAVSRAVGDLALGAVESFGDDGCSARTVVMLTDALSGTGERLVDELWSTSGSLCEIVGGAAGDEGRFQGVHVAANAQLGRGASAALHVASERRWGVGVDHGLTQMTKAMRVTKAEGATVYELDGRPAFDVYRDYALSRGVELHKHDASTFFVNNELGVLFFDQLKKARAPLKAHEDGSLSCAAPVPAGASVCILGGERDDLVAAARRAATEAKQRLGGRPACGLLIFDCICRGAILDSEFAREIDAVREVFPDTPLSGFLTYGEIARYSGRLDGWHNSTVVVVAIPA